MLLGYNTNGLAHHDPADALRLLAGIGYQSVALTLDHGLLNPYAADINQQVERMRGLLGELNLRSVVETGARFLLDPQVKHEPTLLTADSAGRRRRIDFLCRAIDIAAALDSDCVSLWSGILRDGTAHDAAMDRLCEGLAEVIDHAAGQGVTLGFEPEPGMFIDRAEQFLPLRERLGNPAVFRLTLDVGHLHCQGEVPEADWIQKLGSHLVNIHLEDMRPGVHEHLMFGEGEMDFPPIIDALASVGYQGGVHVELSRHSHDGPAAVRQAYEFLRPLVERAGGSQAGRL